MPIHLQKEIEKLKKQIVLLAGAVEKNLETVMRALQLNDVNLAKMVHDSDQKIDLWEVDIEEECLKILALYQPVAIDLRFIVAILKINNDLERIGDEAVNISSRVRIIASEPLTFDFVFFQSLFEKVAKMLKSSINALINLDSIAAKKVCLSDEEVDQQVYQVFALIKNEISLHPDKLDPLIEYMRISRHLERVADHATNIAEDVIYMVEGTIARHHLRESDRV